LTAIIGRGPSAPLATPMMVQLQNLVLLLGIQHFFVKVDDKHNTYFTLY